MTISQIIATLLTLAALGGYINYKYMKLPSTIGHMAFALAASCVLVMAEAAGWIDVPAVRVFVEQIDFSEVLLHGMLAFLLFAGALHINLADLKSVRTPVAVLATVGVAMATFLTGSLVWLASGFAGLQLSYIHALLFGALISPTDPIAVLAMLKQAGASKKMYVKIGGESLFNDGIGIVIFLTILDVTTGVQAAKVSGIILMLVQEAVGGFALGGLLGWAAFRVLRSVDDYKIEVLLTLALVTGGYAIAEYIHVSAPISMVVAGLIVGNQGRIFGMSAKSRKNLDLFWELIDEILNAILFLLIGLEIIVIPMTASHVILGVFAIAAVLLSRFISVALPVTLMSFRIKFERGAIALLTWGGLRGGLSVAMALSLPASAEKAVIVPMTYIVVLFSILVQGLTFRRVLDSFTRST
jgi:CPA1 family monovalent cation:H+ antiporter